MKHIPIAAAVLTLLAGCTIEKPYDEQVTLRFADRPYTQLSVSSAIQVSVDELADSISVTIGESIADRLTVAYSGEKLVLSLKPGTTARQAVKAVLPRNLLLRDIELVGASSFSSAYGVLADSVTVELDGASTLQSPVEAQLLEVEISGAGSSTVSGTAARLELDASGASRLDAKGMTVADADVDISGASHVTLTCTATLGGKLSGASTLDYYGDPEVSVDVTGGSNLNHK